MKPGPDPTTIYRIARYYYESGLSQDEIASREGFSRSQVSRLIDKARGMGMVRITLVPPTGVDSGDCAARIEKGLGLARVVIAPRGTARNPDGGAIARNISTAAIDFLVEGIRAATTIGVGWGRSVYALSAQMPYLDIQGDRHFVPLVGISGDDEPNLQINTIIDRLSSRFHGHGHFVSTPAVREQSPIRPRVEEERIAALHELWKSVDLAIIGLGDPPGPASRYLEEFPGAYREELYASASVGDILGQYFWANGRPLGFAEGFDHLAFELGRLPAISRVICLAGGPDKAVGIATAARASYFTDLVTDEATAEALCAALGEDPGRMER